MRKFILGIGVTALLFMLASCDPGSFQYEYEDLMDDVVEIELVYYDNPGQSVFVSWVPNHFSKLASVNLSRLTVLEELDDSKKPDFLEQLSEADILFHYYVFDSPRGACIRLLHDNGNFTLITCDYANKSFRGYIGEYSSEGKVVDFVGSFVDYGSFEALINDYFEYDLSVG